MRDVATLKVVILPGQLMYLKSMGGPILYCSVLSAVAAYITFISDAQTRVTQEMKAMIIQGLTSLASLLSPHRNTGGAVDECS